MPAFRRNQPANTTVGSQLTFFGLVGIVMTALKLKDRWDDYRQLPNDEEGAVRLPASPNTAPRDLAGGDDDVSMIDTQIARPKRVKKRGCCMCCGMDCTIFWKAIGIVLLLFTVWNTFKLAKWFMTPTPTGLEELPNFGTSLGCSSAPHIYEGAPQVYTIPVAATGSQHTLDLWGAAMGTLTITSAAAGATDITLELTVRTDDAALLQGVSLSTTSPEKITPWTTATLNTPMAIDSGSACMRFDATLRIPAALRSLQVNANSVTQIRLDPHAALNLDTLAVHMAGADARGMLELSAGVQAANMDVRARRGWIVGDVALGNSTAITTTGDCVANVHVRPALPASDATPAPAYLTTVHAAGRTDYFYQSDPAHAHRPIVSSHSSTRGGDLYLTYKDAEFSGPVRLVANSYTASGLQGSVASMPGQVGKALPWVGSADGEDVLVVNSPKGWVGLYF